MTNHHDPLSSRALAAAIIVGLVVTIVGGVAVAPLTASAPSAAGLAPAEQNANPRADGDLEAKMNATLAASYGHRYRVVTDKDKTWDPYELENFVLPQRKKFSYYPYLVIGDFDGDRISDLAAEVRNTENNKERLAIVWSRTNKLTFYDGQLCSAISFLPANEWRSHWEKAAVKLPADAILVECYEKSSWILYWDGRAFQQYWMSD